MIKPAELERGQKEFEVTCQEFSTKMGLSPQDSIDDWTREALIKCPFVNHNVQGDILTRVSVFTKTRALRWALEQFGYGQSSGQV